MSANAFPELGPAVPEIFVAVVAMALLMFGVFRGNKATRAVSWLAALALAVALVLVLVFLAPPEQQITFTGMFIADPFARFMKVLVLLGSILAIVMSLGYIRRGNGDLRRRRPGRRRQQHRCGKGRKPVALPLKS